MVELPAAAVKEHLWNICGNAAVSQTMPWNSDWQAVCDVCGWTCKTPLFKKKAFKDSGVMVCGQNFEVICCVRLLEGKADWPVIKDMLFMPFFVCFFLDRTPCFFARAFFVKTICFSEVFFCRKSWGGRGALMFGQSGGSESCFCYVSW